MIAKIDFTDPLIKFTDEEGHVYTIYGTDGDDDNFCLDLSHKIDVVGNELEKELVEIVQTKGFSLCALLHLIGSKIPFRILIDVIRYISPDNIQNIYAFLECIRKNKMELCNQGKTIKDIMQSIKSVSELIDMPERYINIIFTYPDKYAKIKNAYRKLYLSVDDFHSFGKRIDALDICEDYIDFTYIRDIKDSKYSDYLDYRRMILNLDGDYPRKPENINVWHTRAIVAYNKAKTQVPSTLQENYATQVYDSAKKWDFEDDKFIIFACKNLQDLVIEGQVLCHCVGSYTESVGHGREYILFLRKQKEKDIPYLTVNIRNGEVVQIHGKCNCDPCEEVKPFIKKWLNKMNLQWKSNGRLVHI